MLFADLELHNAAMSMVPLLLAQSVHGVLQALTIPYPLPFLVLAPTLEMTLVPTYVVFSILAWAVLLWV